MWTALFLSILFLGPVHSLPATRQFNTSCNLSGARLQVPVNQTQLAAPNSPPSYIALGVGTQNYTCNGTSYAGAVAELFDMSCLYGTFLFDTVPRLAYTSWEATGILITAQDVITLLGLVPNPLVLGQYMYVLNPSGSGLSPKWDFTSSDTTAGNPNAYVIGAKEGDIPSSNPTVNIDNLMVKGIEGALANLIFRVQNHGGQPPADCSTEALNITVKYTAQYWFFGGNITRNIVRPA